MYRSGDFCLLFLLFKAFCFLFLPVWKYFIFLRRSFSLSHILIRFQINTIHWQNTKTTAEVHKNNGDKRKFKMYIYLADVHSWKMLKHCSMMRKNKKRREFHKTTESEWNPTEYIKENERKLMSSLGKLYICSFSFSVLLFIFVNTNESREAKKEAKRKKPSGWTNTSLWRVHLNCQILVFFFSSFSRKHNIFKIELFYTSILSIINLKNNKNNENKSMSKQLHMGF